jgi:hypothetical protein
LGPAFAGKLRRGKRGGRWVGIRINREVFVYVWADGAGRGFDSGGAFEGCEHEFALGLQVANWFGFCRLASGFDVLVFALFEDEGGAAEARECVKGADVVDWVIDQLLVSEGFKDLADCELVGCLMKLDDVVILDEV